MCVCVCVCVLSKLTHWINKSILTALITLTRAINAACIFCLTCSWRNGDAWCCQLSNIADPLMTFTPFKKAVSENSRYCPVSARSCCPLPACAHTALSLSVSLCASARFSARQTAEEQHFQLNRYYIASLVLYDASIAKITALIFSLSYLYLISSDDR